MSLSYDLTTHVLFSLDTLTVTELSLPLVPSTSASGMGYLGKGLGGYMTLGLGSKGKPCAVNIQDAEVFLTKDSTSSQEVSSCSHLLNIALNR